MKLTKAQKVRLGTFVVTASTLFLGLGLILAGLKVWERRDVYTTRFIESVSGLEVSAPVKYRGLRVGAVQDMRIAADDANAIEVTLALEPGTRLFKGTIAVLDMGGLTGLKSINLVPGDTTGVLIEPGSDIEAGPSLVHRVTGQAEQIVVKIEMVANQLARWTGDENRMRVEKLIDDVDLLARNADAFLEYNREELKSAIEGVGRASDSVAAAAAEAERTLEVARKETLVTLDEAQKTIREARRPLQAIDEGEVALAVTTARKALQKLDQRLSNEELGKAIEDLLVSLKHLSVLIENVDLSVQAGREDFVSSLSNLQEATEDIREFSRIIAQDPSTLVVGKE